MSGVRRPACAEEAPAFSGATIFGEAPPLEPTKSTDPPRPADYEHKLGSLWDLSTFDNALYSHWKLTSCAYDKDIRATRAAEQT